MNSATTWPIILTTVGILFFIAMAFRLLPSNYALFGGVACFILAGMARRIVRQRE